eukprot:48169-Chlamydomonas_euryale.AAC.6
MKAAPKASASPAAGHAELLSGAKVSGCAELDAVGSVGLNFACFATCADGPGTDSMAAAVTKLSRTVPAYL